MKKVTDFNEENVVNELFIYPSVVKDGFCEFYAHSENVAWS